MKPSEEITDQAMEWARRFLARYSTIPRTDIRAYANGLNSKARSLEDPNEAAWCAERAEALRYLLNGQ